MNNFYAPFTALGSLIEFDADKLPGNIRFLTRKIEQ